MGYIVRMKAGVEKYAEKRIRNIRDLLKAGRKAESQVLLHRLRVEIKKIKAILSLLHFHRGKFDEDKAFLAFRDVFRACAEMREPYVRQKLAARFSGQENPPLSVPPELLQRFRDQIPDYLKAIRKQRKQILTRARKITPKMLRKFLSERKKELQHEIFPAFNQKELHENRKRIKEIMYLSALVKSKKKADPFFDRSEELIGNWHDKVVFIERLKESDTQPRDLIKKLQHDCREDLKELKALTQQYYAS